jgi:enterochelin esterase family protein
MALYTGMRLPGIFGRVLSQSGAFFLPDFEFVVVDLVRHAPAAGIRVWMDAGRYEWLLQGNRKMARLLRRQGYALTYREYSGGHNYTCWRDDIGRGLEELFA